MRICLLTSHQTKPNKGLQARWTLVMGNDLKYCVSGTCYTTLNVYNDLDYQGKQAKSIQISAYSSYLTIPEWRGTLLEKNPKGICNFRTLKRRTRNIFSIQRSHIPQQSEFRGVFQQRLRWIKKKQKQLYSFHPTTFSSTINGAISYIPVA